MRKDEPRRFLKRQQKLFVFQDQVVVARLSGLACHLAPCRSLGVGHSSLLIDREVAAMGFAYLNPIEVFSVFNVLQRQLAQQRLDRLRIFLFEHPGIFALFIGRIVIAILHHLVDEEQRQHLHPTREQHLLPLQMRRNRLADLYPANILFGHIARGLARKQDVAIREMHRVIAGIDVGHHEAAIHLQPLGQIEKVASLFKLAGHAFDPAVRLHLQVDKGHRGGRCHIDPVQEQIGVRPAQPLGFHPPHPDFLDQLLVERLDRIQTMHLVMHGLVRRRIAQDEQRVELG